MDKPSYGVMIVLTFKEAIVLPDAHSALPVVEKLFFILQNVFFSFLLQKKKKRIRHIFKVC